MMDASPNKCQTSNSSLSSSLSGKKRRASEDAEQPASWQKRLRLPTDAAQPRSPQQRSSLYQFTRFSNHGRFVRLLSLQPGSPSDTLHILWPEESFSIDSDTSAPYECLSYVWGSKENPVFVDVGPHKQSCLPITQNLSEALRYLRYEDQPRMMWIDAVCINQGDDEERSAQVAMMGDIYKQASLVIVWLGLEEDNSSCALDSLERIGSQIDVDWKSGVVSRSTGAIKTTLTDWNTLLSVAKSDLDAIWCLMYRPWFQRLWIRQEVAFARQATIQVGSRSISWEYFRRAFFGITDPTHRSGMHGLESSRLQLLLDVCTSEKPYTIKKLRERIHGTQCEEPRDRIYAVLSLLHRSDARFDILPDYSKPAAEVYQEVTLKYISTYNSLGLLISCEWKDQTTVPGLPSWAPDWSTDLDLIVVEPTSLCGATFRSRAEFLGDGVLRVAGVECGTVARTAKLDRTSLWAFITSIRQIWSGISPEGSLETQYPDGGSLVDAFCRALLWNNFQDNVTTKPAGYHLFSRLKQEILPWLDSGRTVSRDQLQNVNTKMVLNSISNICYGATFHTTLDGRIGFGPEATKPGDCIAVLLGCQMPILMRAMANNQYRVMGPCYLHGVMSGEPLLGPLPPGVQQVIHANNDIGYLNRDTGETFFEDPRLESLGIDLEDYRRLWENGEFKRVNVEPEVLRRVGCNIRYIDLI